MARTTPPLSTTLSEELVPAAVLQLIALFEAHDDLKFPGVTAETLRARGEEVESQAQDVERLEQELGEAKEALFAQKQQLLLQARQAHAYATIFADGVDEDEGAPLREQLAALQFEPEQKAGRKRRPLPKGVAVEKELPLEETIGTSGLAAASPADETQLAPASLDAAHEPEEAATADELAQPSDADAAPDDKAVKKRSAGVRTKRPAEGLALER